MSLTKQTVLDRVEILFDTNKNIQVRNAIKILENGEVISTSFERYVLTPGDSLDSVDSQVKSIANIVWNA